MDVTRFSRFLQRTWLFIQKKKVIKLLGIYMCKLLSRYNPEFLRRYPHDLCKSFSNDVPVTSARRHILIFNVKQQEEGTNPFRVW